MCNPAAIVLLASAAFTANQQIQEGKAAAATAENNQRIIQNEADQANAMATRESQQAAWRTRAIQGQQRAAIAANNIDSQVGTPAEILGETAMFGAIDQQTIRQNAARQAWGFNAQKTMLGNQAKLAKWSSQQQATGTILSAAASAYGGGGFSGGGGSGIGGVQRQSIPLYNAGYS